MGALTIMRLWDLCLTMGVVKVYRRHVSSTLSMLLSPVRLCVLFLAHDKAAWKTASCPIAAGGIGYLSVCLSLPLSYLVFLSDCFAILSLSPVLDLISAFPVPFRVVVLCLVFPCRGVPPPPLPPR